MIAALFDFDGTLYTGHIWQDLVRHHWAARRHRRWVLAYVAWNMLPYPLYKLGIRSQAAFFHDWGATMGWLLRGWHVDQATALFERLIEDRILPNLRSDVLDRLRHHQAQEHLVALVSGAFAPFLSLVARRLGISHAIGTPLEVRDGRYTGRIVPPLCQGRGKPQRVAAYAAERDWVLDWEASFAYADRYADLPLLGRVGNAVAVYPDEALALYARDRGWPIVAGEAE
jgi:HAD superfamily hydrolase (TIGR01490 family)